MATSHRESVLAASCVHTPVNRLTRAPLTLYERELLERANLSPLQGPRNPTEEDEDDHYCKETWGGQDWAFDISKLHHSNREYYIQVEKLKNAHVQNMEQLEQMYDKKLHLKGVQKIENEQRVFQNGHKSAWEHRALSPSHMKDRLLLSNLPSNMSSASETSHEEWTDEDSSDSESSVCARKKILQMWNDFSVEDYIQNSEYFSEEKLKDKTKSKEWTHKITVPEPFQMTIRESKRKENNVKSKSEIELENNLLKKKLEEEAECQKIFRANPVPASVYLPLYHEIVERNEARRKFVKGKSKDFLLASQKPFHFIEREERKKVVREMQIMDLPALKTNFNHFKAKPVPKSIYGRSAVEKLREEELYRNIRIKMRAQELLQSSSYPTSTLASRSRLGTKNITCSEPKVEQHKPKISASVPNFQAIHQKHQRDMLSKKNAKRVTICDPFHLLTNLIPSNKEKILRDIQADEENLREPRWPYKSPRSHTQIISSQIRQLPEEETLSETPRSTELSKTRELISRKMEKERTQAYIEELEAMEQRVLKKPLLIEQATQKNAQLAAEKHYSNVLHGLGLCEDFVSKKGQRAVVKGPLSIRKKKRTEEERTGGPLKLEDLLNDKEVYKCDSDNEQSAHDELYSTDEDHSEEET
ncbi:hypothetical protein GDO86_009228 [Hymenochirus boettgeri]|uniref:Protein FAM161A n=1 Tax=Hymenochirus boettgeri TaxID=247094 RepID=A0A8T2JKE2_9PIPI|nr:hypothetical protein GDO86_009228 [Hymenochirus boettgeri]